MKFFEHTTDEDDGLVSYRILGITLMEKATMHYKRNGNTNKALYKVYKRFLGRVIYKSRYYNRNGLLKYEIILFSIPIFEILKLNGHKSYFALGIKIYSKPLKFLSDFKSECINNLDKKYDDIYILLHHFGDAFRMLTLIKEIIKNNYSKNPLIMVFDESFIELIKMMRLGIPYIKINTSKPFKKRLETQFSTDRFNLGTYRFILLFNDWWCSTKAWPKTKLFPRDNWLDLFASLLNVTYDNRTMGKIEAPPDAEYTMLEKSRHAGLNLDKFVFIAPESFSVPVYFDSFWSEIIGIYQNTGYDVFLNIVLSKKETKIGSYTQTEFHAQNSKIQSLENIPNVKSFYLTIAEAFSLACRAKSIISHRSGLSEILVQTNVPMCVIYSANNREVAENIKIRNSLIRAPYSNPERITEINVVDMSLSDSIKAVTDSLDI